MSLRHYPNLHYCTDKKHTYTENLLKQIKPVYLQRYSQRGPTNHEPLALVTQPSFTVKLTAWTSLAVH